MEFLNVKVGLDAVVNEILFVLVRCNPSLFKFNKGICGMVFKVCIINKSECCTDNMNKAWFSLASENTKKHLLHVLVFGSGPLCYKGDSFLEVAEVSAMCHGTKVPVNLSLSSTHTFCGPIDNVVFENPPFVQLMKKIRGKAGKYVTVRKTMPKWVVRAQPLAIECLKAESP